MSEIEIMKKLFPVLLMVSFCFSTASANAQTAASQTTKSAKNSFSLVNGAWQSTDHKGFAMMNDGFFSAIQQVYGEIRTREHTPWTTIIQ